jgi:hypothetical protein
MYVKPQAFGTMCRIMDINFYKKSHYKIMESYRHDIMMRKIKEREDKEFRKLFIKISLIITAIVLLVTVVF